jgi:hypothetical protein
VTLRCIPRPRVLTWTSKPSVVSAGKEPNIDEGLLLTDLDPYQLHVGLLSFPRKLSRTSDVAVPTVSHCNSSSSGWPEMCSIYWARSSKVCCLRWYDMSPPIHRVCAHTV